MGSNNHYAAVVKGIILSMYPSVTLVDVTHNVSNFNLTEAAFILKNTYPAFPAGSIHMIAVDPDNRSDTSGVVMLYDEHLFIGPNNGVMSLISEGEASSCVQIENEGLFRTDYPKSFRAARMFAPTAAFLASGGQLEEIGTEVELEELRWGEPTYSNNCLRGKIIYIDKFGNAVTNINKDSFLDIRKNRRFEIFIRNIRLKRIVGTYSDVGKADALAIFGESKNLEIALREASAADLLGLKVDDMITIEFVGKGKNKKA